MLIWEYPCALSAGGRKWNERFNGEKFFLASVWSSNLIFELQLSSKMCSVNQFQCHLGMLSQTFVAGTIFILIVSVGMWQSCTHHLLVPRTQNPRAQNLAHRESGRSCSPLPLLGRKARSSWVCQHFQPLLPELHQQELLAGLPARSQSPAAGVRGPPQTLQGSDELNSWLMLFTSTKMFKLARLLNLIHSAWIDEESGDRKYHYFLFFFSNGSYVFHALLCSNSVFPSHLSVQLVNLPSSSHHNLFI